MSLTVKEISIILDALAAKYGFGYSEVEHVGALQAKLSIMAEVAQKIAARKSTVDTSEAGR